MTAERILLVAAGVAILATVLYDWLTGRVPPAAAAGELDRRVLVLVTPSGVELPYHSHWGLDDVLATLAEVDAL